MGSSYEQLVCRTGTTWILGVGALPTISTHVHMYYFTMHLGVGLLVCRLSSLLVPGYLSMLLHGQVWQFPARPLCCDSMIRAFKWPCITSCQIPGLRLDALLLMLRCSSCCNAAGLANSFFSWCLDAYVHHQWGMYSRYQCYACGKCCTDL